MPRRTSIPKFHPHLSRLCSTALALFLVACIVAKLPMQVNAETAGTLLRHCFPYAKASPFKAALTETAELLLGFNPSDPSEALLRQFTYCTLAPQPQKQAEPDASPSPSATPPTDTLPILETSQTVAALRSTEQKSIYVDNDTSYEIDIAALLKEQLSIAPVTGAPQVLIVHTHTTESYTPEGQSYYTDADSTRTQDKAKNVVRVGEEIARTLTNAGINVLHDTTINDYPSYNGSYTKTLGIIEWYLAHYPTIQVILDVHRDAMIKTDGTKLKTTAEINGEKAAQVMLVIGTNEGGLVHDNWKSNLHLGLHLQEKLTTLYPKFARPLNLRKERFNQHATPGSMIVEVGTDGNTLTEAVLAGKHFAFALAEVLHAQK